MTSPYLQRPVRTYEQAVYDIAEHRPRLLALLRHYDKRVEADTHAPEIAGCPKLWPSE